jgi:hypothetical protein
VRTSEERRTAPRGIAEVPADRYILCNVELILKSGSSESFPDPCRIVCTNDIRRESARTLQKAIRSGKATLWFGAIATRSAPGMKSIYCTRSQ